MSCEQISDRKRVSSPQNWFAGSWEGYCWKQRPAGTTRKKAAWRTSAELGAVKYKFNEGMKSIPTLLIRKSESQSCSLFIQIWTCWCSSRWRNWGQHNRLNKSAKTKVYSQKNYSNIVDSGTSLIIWMNNARWIGLNRYWLLRANCNTPDKDLQTCKACGDDKPWCKNVAMRNNWSTSLSPDLRSPVNNSNSGWCNIPGYSILNGICWLSKKIL